jgi:ubiquitin-like 1-activating enzyme E1 B
MDFVAACANIRSQIFTIPTKSRFDIKSMAGNIIPAIATTNAVIAGGIVLEAIKILMGNEDMCKTVYLTRKPNPKKKVLVPCQLNPPNPKCYVCAEKPEVNVSLNLEKTTIKVLEEKILKGALSMVAPGKNMTFTFSFPSLI